MSTGRVVLVVGAILTGWESATHLSDDCGEVEGKVSLQLMCCCSVLFCVSLTSLCSNSWCSISRKLPTIGIHGFQASQRKVEEGSIELVLPHPWVDLRLSRRELAEPQGWDRHVDRYYDCDANTEDVSENWSREPKKEPEVNEHERAAQA